MQILAECKTSTVILQDDGWMDLFACGELLDDPPSLGCYGGQDG
jgi:hypothetical protein